MASEPPKVLISYSRDSPEHEQRVLELANRFRADGIDCTIDQYVVVPAEGWPRWMEKQIRDSDFVVMVCSEAYYQRVVGQEQPGKGLGVRWEGSLIYNEIYRAGTMNTKFIPVLFEGGGLQWIPIVLQSTTYWRFWERPWARSIPAWRHVWKITRSCYERCAVQRKPNLWKLAREQFGPRAA